MPLMVIIPNAVDEEGPVRSARPYRSLPIVLPLRWIIVLAYPIPSHWGVKSSLLTITDQVLEDVPDKPAAPAKPKA